MRKNVSWPTTLFVSSKNCLLLWNEASTNTGLPSRAAVTGSRERLASELRRVVLEHVAQIGRLVQDEAVRPGVCLDVLDRAAEVEQPRVGLVQLLIGEPDEQRRGDAAGYEQAGRRLAYPAGYEPRDQEQHQRHEDQEVAHLEQRAVERRDDDQQHDEANAAAAEHVRLVGSAAAEQHQRPEQEQRPHRCQEHGGRIGLVAPQRPRHVRQDGVEGQVIVGPARRAGRCGRLPGIGGAANTRTARAASTSTAAE